MAGRMGERYNDVPFPVFFFMPFILWMLFSEVVGRAPSVLKEHGYLITKIAFPVWVLPFVPIASVLLSQVILVILVGGLFAFNGIVPSPDSYVFIILWFFCLIFSLGVAYIVSALSVFIPDLVQTVPVALNIIFWLTPLLYPPRLVEEGGSQFVRALIMHYNPFYYFVELSRMSVFVEGPINWVQVGVLGLFSFVTLFLGYGVFVKLKPGFADVV
jgi:ABC-type polysaccharide/polyol phosphate export permease